MMIMIIIMTTNQGLGRSSDSLLVRSCSIPESIAAKWEMEEYLITTAMIVIIIMIASVIIFMLNSAYVKRIVFNRKQTLLKSTKF